LWAQEIIHVRCQLWNLRSARSGSAQCVLESGAVRVFKAPILPQKGKENHQVNPGGAEEKFLEGWGILWVTACRVDRKSIVPFLAGWFSC
jgi:hypothetical protein